MVVLRVVLTWFCCELCISVAFVVMCWCLDGCGLVWFGGDVGGLCGLVCLLVLVQSLLFTFPGEVCCLMLADG